MALDNDLGLTKVLVIMAGMMLADDRRVAAAWFVAAGVQDDWDRFYDCLISAGRNARTMATPLLLEVVRRFDPGPDGHFIIAGDDSPTKRFGPQVEGAGEQQVRNVWSNIGCWHLNQWMYALVELCSWDVAQSDLADRSHRPWDNPDRRPSHADRRRAISKEMLEKQFLTSLPQTADMRKFRKLIEDLISLSA